MTDGLRSAKSNPGMGIAVDVHDDAQFDVLLALAPYTIHAEAWQQGQPLFSADDTGTALWIAVTSKQETQLMSRLDALEVTQTAFADRPRSPATPDHGAVSRSQRMSELRCSPAR
ncbi:hypothetical protein [Streptomyces sp. NPDC057909]|uniref:hypothetical protein n=1 Tax=Streptomyces sp. NPDC057909 TaxID=3346277 RepID=UPI0036EE1053